MDAALELPQIHARTLIGKPFTRENASENGRKGYLARLEREKQEAAAAEQKRIEQAKAALDTTEQARKNSIQCQIEKIDDEIAACDDSALLVKLVAAKATLYALIYPKPGSLRPRPTKSRQTSQPEPTEIEQEQ